MKRTIGFIVLVFVCLRPGWAAEKKPKVVPPSPLEQFLEQARKAQPQPVSTTGSLFSPNSSSLFLFHDVKARTTNDIVTIQINENASASNTANTSTQKNTNATMAAPGAFGLERSSHMDFTKLLDLSTGLSFGGQGATSRSGQLQAWVSARVVEVLPNGDLVIEGTKDVTINRERQSMSIRGVIRQVDIATNNIVQSTSIAHMEVKFDGKGIVSTANNPGFITWLFNKLNLF
jgi:flagellar L-ring protein precursor FlgH